MTVLHQARIMVRGALFTFFLLQILGAGNALAQQCAPRPYDKGRLFEIARAGQPISYIFGTMHSKDPRILQLPGIIMQAFNRSALVMIETSLNDRNIQTGQALMLAPHGYNLQETLGDERFNKLLEKTRSYGISKAQLIRLKPWSAAIIIAQPPQDRSNKQLVLLDREFEKLALSQRKSVQPLETVLEQLNLFDRLAPDLQIELIDQALKEFPNLEAEIERLTQYYLAGNIGTILCDMEENLEDLSPGLQKLLNTDLIIGRNHTMAQKIGTYLKTGSFVAIGAAHLPGEEGVLKLLEQQGYTVKRKY
jgi:uncharacterized protein